MLSEPDWGLCHRQMPGIFQKLIRKNYWMGIYLCYTDFMPPIDSFKRWMIILAAVVVFVAASSFFVKQFSPEQKPPVSYPPRAFPTGIASQLYSDFKILYQDPKDTVGRTVIYKSSKYKYSGIGAMASGNSRLIFDIIGIVMRWEDISGSRDRYLVLYDPRENNKILGKMRVAFETSVLFEDGLNGTSLAVENLTNGKVEKLNKKVVDIKKNMIDEFIKAGDAVVLIPVVIGSEGGYDGEGNLLASWIVLRRDDGASAINLK